MLNMKKTAVAVLALASSTAFAGTMGPVCTPGNVTVPCEMTAWNVGAQALYLQPTYGAGLGTSRFVTNNSDGTSTIGGSDTDHKWSWGFKVEASYHFSTGNDLNVNWYHLGAKTTTAVVGSYDPAVTDIFGDVTYVADGSVGTIKPKWDAVNVEFGQHVDFGEFKNIRFHEGVQFARIKTNLGLAAVAGSETLAADGTVAFAQENSVLASSQLKYSGVGPRAGMDMDYDLGNGLGMYGNVAAALLIGKHQNRSAVNTDSVLLLGTTAIDLGSSSTVIRNDRVQVVPELEGKLGLTYGFAMAQGDLTLDAGYMVVNYFNAQEVNGNDSDFAVHGPFVGLKWVGNVV